MNSDEARRIERLEGGASPVAAVLVCDALTPAEDADRLIAACAAREVLSVLVDNNDPDATAADWIAPACRERADMIVLGESMAGSQVPVAACMVRAPVHQTWSMTPSESYVRNVMTSFGFPLAVAREALLARFAALIDGDTHRLMRRIDADVDACFDAHLRWGNYGYARVARLHGFDARFEAARGMKSLQAGPGVLAPILAGALLPVIQLTGILLIDVVTFLFAIGALLVVHVPQPERTLEGAQASGGMLKEAALGSNIFSNARVCWACNWSSLPGTCSRALGSPCWHP